jgi:hypothetical protein
MVVGVGMLPPLTFVISVVDVIATALPPGAFEDRFLPLESCVAVVGIKAQNF